MTNNSAKPPVLLIDDEAEIRRAWEETLHLQDFTPQSFEDAERAVATLQADWSGVVLTDLRDARHGWIWRVRSRQTH